MWLHPLPHDIHIHMWSITLSLLDRLAKFRRALGSWKGRGTRCLAIVVPLCAWCYCFECSGKVQLSSALCPGHLLCLFCCISYFLFTFFSILFFLDVFSLFSSSVDPSKRWLRCQPAEAECCVDVSCHVASRSHTSHPQADHAPKSYKISVSD